MAVARFGVELPAGPAGTEADMDTHRDHRSDQTPIVESATEARQGVTGHNVRYVLGFGLAGVIVAFALIYIYYLA